MPTQRYQGVGKLHFPDGRVWGEVRYEIAYHLPTPRSLGRIEGHLATVDDSSGAGFEDILGAAALQLQDGSWWGCTVTSSDGTASDHSGLHPAGPQPRP